jgi:hypothetical protein
MLESFSVRHQQMLLVPVSSPSLNIFAVGPHFGAEYRVALLAAQLHARNALIKSHPHRFAPRRHRRSLTPGDPQVFRPEANAARP